MNARTAAIGIGLSMLLSGTPILADETTPLYTNADLERFDSGEPAPETTVRTEPADWEFVSDFLERSHARIDAERERELARAELAAYTADRPPARVGCLFPCGGIRNPYDGRADRGRGRIAGSAPRVAAIRPIHAGASKAMRMRAQAARRSGSDAFPRRRR